MTGRRYARRASMRMIVRAHGSSSWGPLGRHTNTRRRLGVSAGTFPAYGPWISSDAMPPTTLSPTPADAEGAVSVKAADTSRVPALTGRRTSRSSSAVWL